MINIENLSFSYEEGKPIFENFSACFSKGERVAVSAPSGKGKTTLLRLICSLEKPQKGKIEFGSDYKISYSPQYNDLFPWYSAVNNVSLVSDEKTAEKWLDLFELSKNKNQKPDSLSGGMKKRVSLAKAAAYEPDIMLIDEGFNGLDDELKFRIMDILKEHFSNRLIIFTSHNKEEIDCFATRTVFL